MKASKQQNVDEAVRELEDLKPAAREVAVMKTQSMLFSNVNGKEEHHLNKDQLYEKDGKLVARLSEKVDKEGDKNPRLKAELDIPSRNIHKVLEKEVKPHGVQEEQEKRTIGNRLQYSPQDLAEYVFYTGDERGATAAVEEFIQDGFLSREEAINYLEDIKHSLELIRGQYMQHEEDAYSRKQEKYQMGPELSEIRQQIKENFNKKTDYQDPASLQGMSEEDYEELVERVKMADLMYNEYSLEEIIYQLAKIMFRQSLTKGSPEAQDSLQKFTDFLENEAQSGRISKTLEKKVLDVVIASLSDVLTQNPELVGVARESLGLLPPSSLSHKQGEQMMGREETHRFKGKKEATLQTSGLQENEKKTN